MTIKKLKISALVSDLSHYALCVSNSNPSCHRHIQIQITPYLVPYILSRGEHVYSLPVALAPPFYMEDWMRFLQRIGWFSKIHYWAAGESSSFT